MPNIKTESLSWLDKLSALEAELEKKPSAKNTELAETLKCHKSMVTFLKAIQACFDQAAIGKIRAAALGNSHPNANNALGQSNQVAQLEASQQMPFILSFNSALELTGLEGRVADLPGAVHAALDVILSQRLATKHIKALVDWIASGKPASEFNPKAKPPKEDEETTEPDTDESESGKDEEKNKRTNSKKVKTETLGQWIGNGIDKIVRFFRGGQGQAHASGSTQTSGHGSAKSTTAKEKKAALKWFKKLGEKFTKGAWKELFKVEHRICRKLTHAIVPLHTSSHSTSSRRSGRHSGRSHNRGSIEKGLITLFLTVLHWVIYVLLQYCFLLAVATFLVCPFVPALKSWLQWPFRFAAHLAVYDFPVWVWAQAQTHLGPTLVVGGVLLIGLYFVGKAEPVRMSLLCAGLAYLIIQGRGWSVQSAPWSKSVVSEIPAVSATPAETKPVRSAELESAKLKPKTSNSIPVASYQPSSAFNTAASPADSSPVMTLYDPKLLEQEIAAVPKFAIVKAFPVSPDETMPGDLAVSRMQGVTDPDKYTLIIGGAKQIIVSITATTTNLIINYKSADAIGGLFSNGSVATTLFWEDVLYIHSDEINVQGKTPLVFYQCSLIGSGAKNALTFQCASANDLKHLVSTMEYFIRNSRLAHDTALGGMPYPSQGLRLNNDCLVNWLWADSPADKSGVQLGDMVWSVDKNAPLRPERKNLEIQLTALTLGPHALYIVSPTDRDNGLVQMNAAHSNSFNPQRHKVVLDVL